MLKKLPLLLLAADVAFTLWIYDQLPERMAIHWGLHGPNGWSGRAFGAWSLPVITAVVWAILKGIPFIDPRRANFAKFQDAYDTLIVGMVTFMVVIHVALLGYALGWPVRVERVVPVGIGLLFLLIGNTLPKARSNFFVGIRTPWTLSSDVVWERTHRMAGRLFMVAGLCMMSLAFLRSERATWAMIILMAVLTLSIIPYSYFVWRSVERSKPTNPRL